MPNHHLDQIKQDYSDLDEVNKIFFLEWLYKTDRHKYDFSTMCEPLQKFHDPKAKR